MFDIIFFSTLFTVFSGLLWGPTIFVLLQPKHRAYKYIFRIAITALLVEIIIATGLIFLADRIGLLNPAGYGLGIILFIGILGAFVINRFWQSLVK
jgi:hypothetical protein